MRAHLVFTCALILAACGETSSQGADTTGPDAAGSTPSFAAGADAAAGDIVTADDEEAGGADLSGLPEAYQSADVAAGGRTWFLCAACHQINDGTSHAVGPDLHGIFGAPAAGNETFPLYSPALKASDIVWDAETLDAWFANPRDVIPSTTMIFPGVRDEQDRINLIGYLWVEAGASE